MLVVWGFGLFQLLLCLPMRWAEACISGLDVEEGFVREGGLFEGVRFEGCV